MRFYSLATHVIHDLHLMGFAAICVQYQQFRITFFMLCTTERVCSNPRKPRTFSLFSVQYSDIFVHMAYGWTLKCFKIWLKVWNTDSSCTSGITFSITVPLPGGSLALRVSQALEKISPVSTDQKCCYPRTFLKKKLELKLEIKNKKNVYSVLWSCWSRLFKKKKAKKLLFNSV